MTDTPRKNGNGTVDAQRLTIGLGKGLLAAASAGGIIWGLAQQAKSVELLDTGTQRSNAAMLLSLEKRPTNEAMEAALLKTVAPLKESMVEMRTEQRMMGESLRALSDKVQRLEAGGEK